MPRVTPSQVVTLIETNFPDRGDDRKMTTQDIPYLSAVDQMISEIPQELLTISGQDYGDFLSSLASIKSTISQIERASGTGARVKPPKVGTKVPLVALLDLLKKCPDTNPDPGTNELPFISDADLRESVHSDIGTAYSAFHNAEWKPATVLAGAVIEALLLWAIGNSGKAAIITNPKGAPLENWTLAEYISGAEKLKLIKPETAILTKQAQDFRNLIHPGRAARLGTNCSRATTLAALAAVDQIVRDLTR